jgi:cytoskeletal protein RodZ
MFSALLLSEGSHDIELTYQTPGLRLGVVVSLGTIVLFILFLLLYGIISAILRGRGKRRSQIPVGTYEPLDQKETAVSPEDTAVRETAPESEDTAEEETEEPAEDAVEEQAEEPAEGPAAEETEVPSEDAADEQTKDMTATETAGEEEETEETGTEE